MKIIIENWVAVIESLRSTAPDHYPECPLKNSREHPLPSATGVVRTPRNLKEEHQETQRNVSPSEQEEDERGPMPTFAIKDLLKKWEAVRAMVLEWHPNQVDVSRFEDLYNDNTINYFRKILKKREKQSTLDMFSNAP
ncbi:uncharacterized protein TNCV_3146811 [Trichonephila clavipes]|nr:uncharacterized protein TNCV_3146811 [Trichonephila clavipes]